MLKREVIEWRGVSDGVKREKDELEEKLAVVKRDKE